MKNLLSSGFVLSTACALLLVSGTTSLAAECNGTDAMFNEGIPYECQEVKVERIALQKGGCMEAMFSEGIDYACPQEAKTRVYSRSARTFSGDMNSEGITFAEIEHKSEMASLWPYLIKKGDSNE